MKKFLGWKDVIYLGIIACLILYIALYETGYIRRSFLSFLDNLSSPNSYRVNSQPSNPIPAQNPTPPPAVAPTPVPTVDQSRALRSVSTKDSFAIGDIKYSVISVEDIGSKPSITDNTSGKYIRLRLQATNEGVQTRQVDLIVYYIQDSKGRMYNAESDYANDEYRGLGYDPMVKEFGSSMMYPRIKPGFTEKLISRFEVSKESEGFSLIMGNGKGQNYLIPLGI